jgi:hypothetical protein
MINGVFCHETGCPNTNSRYDEDSETWVKQRECFECGCTVDADDECCNAPFEDDEDEEDEESDEDSEVWNHVSIRYNVGADGAVTEWQILDHGREHSSYFQGCGVAFTTYEHVSTGIGNDASEAMEDALEMMAQQSHTVTDAQEQEMRQEIA